MTKWEKLKEEWLNGPYETLVEFGKAKGISYSTLSKQAMKYQWHEDRLKLEKKAHQSALDKLARDRGGKIANAVKQRKIAAENLWKAAAQFLINQQSEDGKTNAAITKNNFIAALKEGVMLDRLEAGEATENIADVSVQYTDDELRDIARIKLQAKRRSERTV